MAHTGQFRHNTNSIGTAAYVRLVPFARDAKDDRNSALQKVRFVRRPRQPGLCLALQRVAWGRPDSRFHSVLSLSFELTWPERMCQRGAYVLPHV